VRNISANHYTVMLDPWVAEVGALINAWLRSTAAFKSRP
jgi:hypothetical protein